MTLESLRYPIGKFTFRAQIRMEEIAEMIKVIEELPAKLRNAVSEMSDDQLNTPYRDGGWTVRQVVHHLFDSHSNSYTRMKLAMTEENPTIKPYEEARWAELEDGKNAPVELGLNLLELLHKRWGIFLHSFAESDLQRTFFHPENKRSQTIAQTIALYAWHSRHHLAHITELKKRMGWT
ncbi:MAG: bacillithiol transferase BstA [Bacteroidia bacterium]|nr:bacillithiol transferase BstA [Bacteroidia bacterium]